MDFYSEYKRYKRLYKHLQKGGAPNGHHGHQERLRHFPKIGDYVVVPDRFNDGTFKKSERGKNVPLGGKVIDVDGFRRFLLFTNDRRRIWCRGDEPFEINRDPNQVPHEMWPTRQVSAYDSTDHRLKIGDWVVMRRTQPPLDSEPIFGRIIDISSGWHYDTAGGSRTQYVQPNITVITTSAEQVTREEQYAQRLTNEGIRGVRRRKKLNKNDLDFLQRSVERAKILHPIQEQERHFDRQKQAMRKSGHR